MKKILTSIMNTCSIKQTNVLLCKNGRRFKLFTRTSLFRMWGEWYYLVSSSRDVYA